MTTRAQPLWRGRTLAVLGILLCAFSLRSAVASLSPLLDTISAEVDLSAAVIGVIGTLPPVCFAVLGLITPLLERRLGLERLAVIALAAISVGLLVRGFSENAPMLLITTMLIFAGVGMGNILVPPLVKLYFPDRIGLMMTMYSSVMAVSTFVPPLIAVPLADAAGWRFSVALWGVFAVAGLIPWILMLRNPAPRPEPSLDSSTLDLPPEAFGTGPIPTQSADTSLTGPIPTSAKTRSMFARLVRIPLVWALAVVFGTSSTMAYATFAWMPKILTDMVGLDAASAGSMLSLFAFMGLPSSLLVPILVVRWQATRPVFFTAVICGLAGISGLLFVPVAGLVWLWIMLYGLSGLLFPLALVLISIRARTSESAVVLSSFVQSIGYVIAAIFPVLLGVLNEATGDWVVPLVVLAAVLVVVIPAGIVAGRRVTVEDEWERRYGTW